MVRIIWTDKALKDLEDIGEYISKDSVVYARNVVSKLFKSPVILKEMPRAGRIVPELNREDVRELIRGNYRIVYLIKEASVEILTVHHSAREFPENIIQSYLPLQDKEKEAGSNLDSQHIK
jgi:toxin ParE1/3/4